MNIPMTPDGIEPATFRFVAQHLNHCATAVPLQYSVVKDVVSLTVTYLDVSSPIQLPCR